MPGHHTQVAMRTRNRVRFQRSYALPLVCAIVTISPCFALLFHTPSFRVHSLLFLPFFFYIFGCTLLHLLRSETYTTRTAYAWQATLIFHPSVVALFGLQLTAGATALMSTLLCHPHFIHGRVSR